MCVSLAGSRLPPPISSKTTSPVSVNSRGSHPRLIAQMAVVRKHELVAVAMIDGHHFRFFTRENGFDHSACPPAVRRY